jgi:hypothetical protein
VGRCDVETRTERGKYRAVVACLVVSGLVVDYLGYCLVNMVSWMGGPLALFAIMAYTVVNGLVLWFLPTNSKVVRIVSTVIAMILWPFVSLFLFGSADPIQQKLWIQDTERVAREYGKGELPPGCEITGTYRGNVHTPLECNGSETELAAWYRARLGPEWKETKEEQVFTFRRSQPGRQDQVGMVYYETTFGSGARVLVSPTQTNKL